MNKILSQYLANVSTTAETAPFGSPGLWSMNYLFNNAVVWAAASLDNARRALDEEDTEDNAERVESAMFKFHTIKGLRNEYADVCAIPALEQPHVARYLGIDKEPDVTALETAAKNEAKAAYKNALIAGRNVQGLIPRVYNAKMESFHQQREKRKEQLVSVFGICHEDFDKDYYDEGHRYVADFLERLEDACIVIARSGWLRARDALTDTSMRTFKPSKYTRFTAQLLQCQSFLSDQGITEKQLIDWAKTLEDVASAEAKQFAGSLADAEKLAEQELAKLNAGKDTTPVSPKKKLRKGESDKARAQRLAATEAARKRKQEDAALADKKAKVARSRSEGAKKAAATRKAKKAHLAALAAKFPATVQTH